jgi:hypothetical protein
MDNASYTEFVKKEYAWGGFKLGFWVGLFFGCVLNSAFIIVIKAMF